MLVTDDEAFGYLLSHSYCQLPKSADFNLACLENFTFKIESDLQNSVPPPDMNAVMFFSLFCPVFHGEKLFHAQGILNL